MHEIDINNKLTIDLSENLASAKLLIPRDPDFPIWVGKYLNQMGPDPIRTTTPHLRV